MITQTCFDRSKLLSKINGHLAFLNAAFTALNHADIGEKVVTQMFRGITAIRAALRQADSPELEAFVCDFHDLLSLICDGEIEWTTEIARLARNSTQALARGVEALEQGEPTGEDLHEARDAVFNVLLDYAVKVKVDSPVAVLL